MLPPGAAPRQTYTLVENKSAWLPARKSSPELVPYSPTSRLAYTVAGVAVNRAVISSEQYQIRRRDAS